MNSFDPAGAAGGGGPGWNAGYGMHAGMGPAPGAGGGAGGGEGGAVSDVFGLIVPGRPVVTEFQCVLFRRKLRRLYVIWLDVRVLVLVDAGRSFELYRREKCSGLFCIVLFSATGWLGCGRALAPDKAYVDIEAPWDISEVSLFMLPGQTIPEDQGVGIFWAAPPFEEFQSLGTLSAGKHSGFFRTGWPTNPAMRDCPAVRIGISLETADSVSSIESTLTQAEFDKLGFAQLVATDLANYIGSFGHATPAGDRIMVPPDVVDRWLERFERKFRQDPNFLLRPHD